MLISLGSQYKFSHHLSFPKVFKIYRAIQREPWLVAHWLEWLERLPVRIPLAAMKVPLVRKALANHLINGSGYRQKMAALDAVSQTQTWQYTSLSYAEKET